MFEGSLHSRVLRDSLRLQSVAHGDIYRECAEIRHISHLNPPRALFLKDVNTLRKRNSATRSHQDPYAVALPTATAEDGETKTFKALLSADATEDNVGSSPAF